MSETVTRTCSDAQPCAVHQPAVFVCGFPESVPAEERARMTPRQLAPFDGWVNGKAFWPRRGHTKHQVIVDCCERRVHIHETEGHLTRAFSGYVVEWQFRCAADKGCNVNPNYKRTAHLRYYERG